MKQVIIILLCLSLVACVKQEQDRSGLIKKELKLKVEEYKNRRLKTCRKELVSDINIEVDSIMYFLVEKMKGKSDEMPIRPDRPGRLVDTISLENKPNDIN